MFFNYEMSIRYRFPKKWTPEENIRMLDELAKTFKYMEMVKVIQKELGRSHNNICKQLKSLFPKNINLIELSTGNEIHQIRYKNFLEKYRSN